jgi:hypothetical protein
MNKTSTIKIKCANYLKLLSFLVSFILWAINGKAQTTVPFTTAGTTTWTVPQGVTSIQVEAWGGGGAGAGFGNVNAKAAPGGSGGNYVKNINISVTPGTIMNVSVGAGGLGANSSGANGSASSVSDASSTLLIRAGGGIGGTYSSSTGGTGGVAVNTDNFGYSGSFNYIGGNGAAGNYTTSNATADAGGGGGAAGTNGNGSAASGYNGGLGNGGGNGANGSHNVSAIGVAGSTPGGGGSGAMGNGGTTGKAGGNGGTGQVIITYIPTTPSVNITASLSAFTTTNTAPSAAQSFTVSGLNLSADVVVTAPTNYEVSTSNGGTYTQSVNLTNTGGTLSATTIWVRLKSGLTQGSKGGNITVQSTGATDVTTTPSGIVSVSYYYAGSGDLAAVANWGTNTDGSGTNPIDFISAGGIFNIQKNATTAAAWTVSGTNSKIILGDPSLTGLSLTIANGFGITGTIDITAASSGGNKVYLENTIAPTFGSMDAASEIYFRANVSTGTTKTFGKIFIENNATVTFSGTPVVQTSLNVVSGSTLATEGLSGNYFVINSGASVVINGTFKTQKAAGFVSSNVTTAISTGGAIQFLGAENLTLGSGSNIIYNRVTTGSTTFQVVTPRTDYKNLTINTTGTIPTVTLSSTTIVAQTLTVDGVAVLNSAGFLTLKSDINGTAKAITTGGGTISGNVTVQRYLNNVQRGWRMLGSPLTSTPSLSSVATASGLSNLSYGASNSSAITYDSNNNSWTNLANSSDTWAATTGLGLFIRGAGSEGVGGNYTANPTSVTLSLTGTVNTSAPAQVNITAGKWYLVANPYPAPISVASILQASTGLKSTIAIYSPTKAATDPKVKAGGYDTYAISTTTAGAAGDVVIPVMGTFFVQADVSANATLNIPTSAVFTGTNAGTSAVVANVQNAEFIGLDGKTIANTNDNSVSGISRLKLRLESNGTTNDEINFLFDGQAKATTTDRFDFGKLPNTLLDFYSVSADNKNMAVDQRNLDAQRIPLGIQTNLQQHFTLVVDENTVPATKELVLHDYLLNTNKVLQTGTTYEFNVTAASNSKGTQRLELIVQDAKSAITPTNLSLQLKGETVKWWPNPAKEFLYIESSLVNTKAATVEIVNVYGQKMKTLSVQPGAKANVAVANWTSGLYLIKITNGNSTTTHKLIID